MINTGIAAKFAEKETPFYYYDLHVLNKTLEAAHAASHKRGFHVHYALKANFNDEL
ncbi:MAG TPA: diaminopimelate decarboxylase, partial [Sphingobacterium sp.]|nr:diaminopimelate decarboxylase [Sphingobacterium sp.]